MVWFGRTVDDGDDQGSGTRQFEGNMFKGLSRQEGWKLWGFLSFS